MHAAGATAQLMAKLIPQYLDPRVCSVVGTNEEGDRNTTAVLLKSKFDHIFFTGSPSVGMWLMLARVLWVLHRLYLSRS